MTIIYVLLIAHFVADWLCQTDWMALNKSKRWDALAAHVAVYSLVLATALTPWIIADGPFWSAFLLVNAAAHFVQDAITSRINARLWFFDMAKPVYWPSRRNPHGPAVQHFAVHGGDRHWFFVAIGFDQLLHYLVLFKTAEWWLA